MVRLLIADDHDVVRAGLRRILEARADWSVVAEAADGRRAIAQAITSKPDVAIVDYSLPLINGVEATRQIRMRVPTVEVLIFTMHDNETILQDLLQAGARGYLLKSDVEQHLYTAVEALAVGRSFFTGRASERILDAYLMKSKADGVLTSRERGIVQLIAEGHSNKAIAGVLNISIKTVETHRSNIMHKLNFDSTAALVRYAIRNKLVEP
jgi:DNA-binding NarL/FixJ family response regulator